MGFTTPVLPEVEPEEFLRHPLMERIRIMVLKWVDYGYGVPQMIHVLYIVKLVLFYALLGVVIATVTSDLPAFWHVSQWWNQPIVYQKAVLWTVLLELIGFAGSWGPLAGKTKPMTGGYRFWARLNTIRLRPWKWVPFTAGDRRTCAADPPPDPAVQGRRRGTRRDRARHLDVEDAVKEQPWLPNGPIPLNVTWTRAGADA